MKFLMIIYFGWCREAFAKFDHNIVVRMDENDITEISSNKELLLAQSRVRCIGDNAKCIQKASVNLDLISFFG